MGCQGLHCDGCDHGSGGGPAAAVIVLLIFIAVGVRAAWPQIVHAAEIAAWTMAGIAGTAVTVTGAVLTVRAVRRARARRQLAQPAYRVTPVIPAAHLTDPPAIDRPRFGDITPGVVLPERPAFGETAPTQLPSSRWPLPGWWEELRPRIGGDSDAHER